MGQDFCTGQHIIKLCTHFVAQTLFMLVSLEEGWQLTVVRV